MKVTLLNSIFLVTIRHMTVSTADHHTYDTQKVGRICTSRLVHVMSYKTCGSWRTRKHPGHGCLSGINQDSYVTARLLAYVHFPGHILLPGSGEKFSSFPLLNLEHVFKCYISGILVHHQRIFAWSLTDPAGTGGPGYLTLSKKVECLKQKRQL